MGFEETVLSEKQLKERLGNDIIVGPRAKESLLFQAEITWKAGQEDCAKTHFKPDWEIKAQDIIEAEQVGYKSGYTQALLDVLRGNHQQLKERGID